MSISNDNISEIVIGTITNYDVPNPIVVNLRDCIMSENADVALSGSYRFKLKKCDC